MKMIKARVTKNDFFCFCATFITSIVYLNLYRLKSFDFSFNLLLFGPCERQGEIVSADTLAPIASTDSLLGSYCFHGFSAWLCFQRLSDSYCCHRCTDSAPAPARPVASRHVTLPCKRCMRHIHHLWSSTSPRFPNRAIPIFLQLVHFKKYRRRQTAGEVSFLFHSISFFVFIFFSYISYT